MAGAVQEPDYAADESTEEGFVRLKVKITDLKVKELSWFDSWFKRHPLPEGKNAEIENPVIASKSFELNVRGNPEGAMKGAHYRLKLKQLPYTIDPEKCYLSGEDGWISVFLKKGDKTQSWEKYIRDGNLDVSDKEQKD